MSRVGGTVIRQIEADRSLRLGRGMSNAKRDRLMAIRRQLRKASGR